MTQMKQLALIRITAFSKAFDISHHLEVLDSRLGSRTKGYRMRRCTERYKEYST